MTSSFTSESDFPLGRIGRMCVRCVTDNLGCLRIASDLSTSLLLHRIWDCTGILSFSVTTVTTARAFPPNFRGVRCSTGLLYRPPWWRLILLICHRLIDSCHYSVCKERTETQGLQKAGSSFIAKRGALGNTIPIIPWISVTRDCDNYTGPGVVWNTTRAVCTRRNFIKIVCRVEGNLGDRRKLSVFLSISRTLFAGLRVSRAHAHTQRRKGFQ